jgi:predicted methyltransferase MtxX (methanogen marker protein 4)
MEKTEYSTVLEALKRNRMDAMYVETKEEARALVEELIPEGAITAVGGSVTLDETGILDLLRSEKYRFLDRYQEGLTKEQKESCTSSALQPTGSSRAPTRSRRTAGFIRSTGSAPASRR